VSISCPQLLGKRGAEWSGARLRFTGALCRMRRVGGLCCNPSISPALRTGTRRQQSWKKASTPLQGERSTRRRIAALGGAAGKKGRSRLRNLSCRSNSHTIVVPRPYGVREPGGILKRVSSKPGVGHECMFLTEKETFLTGCRSFHRAAISRERSGVPPAAKVGARQVFA
jgi:hypothetical protein